MLQAVRDGNCIVLSTTTTIDTGKSVAALAPFAALALIALHVVAQLLFEHQTCHLNALRTLEAGVWLLVILLASCQRSILTILATRI